MKVERPNISLGFWLNFAIEGSHQRQEIANAMYEEVCEYYESILDKIPEKKPETATSIDENMKKINEYMKMWEAKIDAELGITQFMADTLKYFNELTAEAIKEPEPKKPDILKRIRDEQYRYLHQTGREPQYIYLGHLELNALVDWEMKTPFFRAVIKDGGDRSVIYGMKLYTVKEQSFLRAGE